jgi:hypothetical protein
MSVEAMDEAAWGQLRQRVRARMQEERLTYKRLGAQLHPPLTESTTTNSINRKSPPGPKVVESLRTWLASKIMPSMPRAADPLAVLAKALKRKLHRAALTRTKSQRRPRPALERRHDPCPARLIARLGH